MNFNKIIFSTLLTLILSVQTSAQSTLVKAFQPVCDTLATMMTGRCGVSGELKLKAVMRRGNSLDFYFTESLSDFPWYKGDPQWFRSSLKDLFPEEYSKYRTGEIYGRGVPLDMLVTPRLTFKGNPAESRNMVRISDTQRRFVTENDGLFFSKGLENSNIALWQSHGRYYDNMSGRWRWQRPCLFQTCEDMFTQSFVLPFLVPMLENAGAYVMLPRERDIQRSEVIADNDSTYNGPQGRIVGRYEEYGKWEDAGTGFADIKATYAGTENPFTLGTARIAQCVAANSNRISSKAVWHADVPERGEYAVYVSYKSMPESSENALYTVTHRGGCSEIIVNQKMGGGRWVYIGTFEFDDKVRGSITLDSRTPKGYRHHEGRVITADGVKIGGGMGNIERGSGGCGKVSGMARSAEGARYWLQWAGADSTIYYQNEGKDDYKDDFMSRGDWVAWMNKDIPIDLSMGFHSDAGVTPGDSLVGTLAIYTLKSEGKRKYPSGEDRMTSREFADIVQSQVVNDIRAEFDTSWTRRALWDRAYRESRTPTCPSMLLEILSHQNFADMKYGSDPAFRFTASRAVYKGIVKYLSNRYGRQYVIQPLPVRSMSVTFKENISDEDELTAVVSWMDTEDRIEATAVPGGYILYSRIDDGAFDKGKVISTAKRKDGKTSVEVKIKKGHVYSFKVVAYNDGGKSFPSETLSIGVPHLLKNTGSVLIVNNFDRISGPAYHDDENWAGFDNRTDSGVPYIRDIAFVGEMYQNRRELEWLSDDNPGFGASYGDMAGSIIAGNTFDYPAVHGHCILDNGFAFCSCSREAFCMDTTLRKNTFCIDLICGKQTAVPSAGERERFRVFDKNLQEAIREYTASGGSVLVSGANIGTDIWDRVFPVATDSTFRKSSIDFATKTLGFKWAGNHASRKGCIEHEEDVICFHNSPNDRCYHVETPDGIMPSSKEGTILYRYADTGIPAGIRCDFGTYRTICIGFPIETIKDTEDIRTIMGISLEYLSEPSAHP